MTYKTEKPMVKNQMAFIIRGKENPMNLYYTFHKLAGEDVRRNTVFLILYLMEEAGFKKELKAEPISRADFCKRYHVSESSYSRAREDLEKMGIFYPSEDRLFSTTSNITANVYVLDLKKAFDEMFDNVEF